MRWWIAVLGLVACACAGTPEGTGSRDGGAPGAEPDANSPSTCTQTNGHDLGLYTCSPSSNAPLAYPTSRVHLPPDQEIRDGYFHSRVPIGAIWVGEERGPTSATSFVALRSLDDVAYSVGLDVPLGDLPSVPEGTEVTLRWSDVGLEFRRSSDGITLLQVGSFEGNWVDFPDLTIAGLRMRPVPICQKWEVAPLAASCTFTFEINDLVVDLPAGETTIGHGRSGNVSMSDHTYRIINRALARRDYGACECASATAPTIAVDVVLLDP
ncbi:MAG: hypothetical protein GXP55_21605 [Deltaproteobacteria bacterium]|nr:hypothetical protein [Deltaproteobacteria bacterium]